MQRLAKSLYFRHFQAHTGIFVCMDACWPSHVRDAIDAGIRSGFEPIGFFMRLNLIAWFRFVSLVLKELFIRVRIPEISFSRLQSYRQVDEALKGYLSELRGTEYNEETRRYHKLQAVLSGSVSEKEMNAILIRFYETNGFSLPWEGDFDEFMGNKTNRLVFQ